MKPENDQLAVLRRMRKEGRISKEEFENLTGGLVSSPHAPDDTFEASADAFAQVDPVVHDGEGAPVDEETASPEALPTPTLRKDLSAQYLAGLAIAAVAMLAVSSLGMVSWWVSIAVVFLLATTIFEGWGKVTVIGAAVVAGIFVISLIASTLDSPEIEETVTATLPPQDPNPPIPGSLGISMDQIIDLWNTVETAPTISRGLTRYNDIGEYDSFIYRFGDWARIAGAFDPDSEAIYALLVTGHIGAEDTDQLYLHTCFVVAPYSQECIDSYYEVGLGGGSLADFTDLAHEAQWNLGEHSWALEIAENVMTIRVYGADAT